jgi:N6-L-threonylcarbamoyladenine synthase
MKNVMSFGIESTSHTFSIGICEDEKIIANEKSTYVPKKGKGIIPREAAEHHTQNVAKIFESALKKAKIKIEDVDVIAIAIGAGLPPCLRVGLVFSRYLALKYKKPLVPVCHQVAHIEIGKLTTGSKDSVVLYLSGGNTQVIAFTEGRYRIFGETEDVPVGNAIDTLAREIGLPPPYGSNFDKTAEKGEYIELPYVVKGMDLSFTGIVTNAIKKFKSGVSQEDVCFSFQETCFAMLTEVCERALAHTDKKEVLLVGGVAASKRMQEMVKIMCKERGARMFVVPWEYAGDCGINIAWTGLLAYNSDISMNIEKSKIRQKWRTDEAEIPWIQDENVK